MKDYWNIEKREWKYNIEDFKKYLEKMLRYTSFGKLVEVVIDINDEGGKNDKL